MESWAKRFCESGNPYVVAVFDQGRVVGIAPFHTHKSRIGADRLEILGNGKACGEYVGILIDPQVMEPVIEHLSQWMMESAIGLHGDENRWQRLDLESVALDDFASKRLCQNLATRGAQWIEGDAAPCWRIDLRETEAQWLARLHKSVRRKLCFLQNRGIHTGRALYKVASTQAEKAKTFEHLVRMHNERRKRLGDVGCFESPDFSEFLREVISSPESDEMVKLSLVELDAMVVAAGLCFESEDGLFIYQTGISLQPEQTADRVAANPGWLLNLFHIQYARERRLSFVDYLRGNETYKRQLGAVATPVNFHMIVPPTTAALVRQRIWNWAQTAKGFGKEVIEYLPQL
jgi:hypothetical protein